MIVENTMSMSLSLSKEDFLFNSLMKYYNKVENMQLVSEILKNNTMISLRLIDWFVTKHSKSNGIQYETEGKIFSVYSNYKTQLKAFSKKVFDPFCRSTRFTLKKHGIVVVTTVGQLNFFRWAIENKVLKYIFEKEMASADTQFLLPFGVVMCAPVVYTFGTQEQKDKFLPGILSGEDF